MNIPYRTRRILYWVAVIAAIVLLVGAVAWLCWFTWLGRFVVYTRSGAKIDFSLSQRIPEGQVATPYVDPDPIPIYYNEGENAITTNRELTQLTGYYVNRQMLINGIDQIRENARQLKRGTPVMIELKSASGNFFYSSTVAEYRDSKIDPVAVDALIQELDDMGLYLIAQVPAFRDRQYGLHNVNDGIFDTRGAYLFSDGGTYWLNPKRQGVMDYVVQIISELQSLGFDEVALDCFDFPDTEYMRFDGDKTEALQTAANAISTLATGNFAVSFVQKPGFQVPSDRSRLYVKGADAAQAQMLAQMANLQNPAVQLVFWTENHDTRFEEFSVLRPLDAAH